MLHFLTDEHISPAIAGELVKRVSGIRVTALKNWHKGDFLGADDRLILQKAAQDAMTLVTYDQKTIRPLLKQWAETDIQHAGVVFVDHKSIRPNDFGGLVKALGALWNAEKDPAWANRVVFLRLSSR